MSNLIRLAVVFISKRPQRMQDSGRFYTYLFTHLLKKIYENDNCWPSSDQRKSVLILDDWAANTKMKHQLNFFLHQKVSFSQRTSIKHSYTNNWILTCPIIRYQRCLFIIAINLLKLFYQQFSTNMDFLLSMQMTRICTTWMQIYLKVSSKLNKLLFSVAIVT